MMCVGVTAAVSSCLLLPPLPPLPSLSLSCVRCWRPSCQLTLTCAAAGAYEVGAGGRRRKENDKRRDRTLMTMDMPRMVGGSGVGRSNKAVAIPEATLVACSFPWFPVHMPQCSASPSLLLLLPLPSCPPPPSPFPSSGGDSGLWLSPWAAGGPVRFAS